MISVAAIRMQQFGVQFYQASLTASDIDKLVRFEVLSYQEQGQAGVRGKKKGPQTKINWDLLERRIASNEKAYQRQIIRKKIDELVEYYEQCRQARDLPSIPGAVIISCDEKLSFEPTESGSWVGRLKVPEREGILRAIDGQHRLLALHADIDRFGDEPFTVPAIIFDRVPEDHIVQMFVTINAKHTRLNASHLVSLSGRQLYRDEALAAAHDVVRAHQRPRRIAALRRDQAARRRQGPRRPGAARAGAQEAVCGRGRARRRPQERTVPRGVEEVFRQLLQADRQHLRVGMERPQVQHQVGHRAARVHPRRAGCDPEDRSAPRRSHRLPRHRPGHFAVGPPHRRAALRDRRRVEAAGHDGR